jgi:hypothetical protein
LRRSWRRDYATARPDGSRILDEPIQAIIQSWNGAELAGIQYA